MKRGIIIFFLMVVFISNSKSSIYRVLDPNDPNERYGKNPEQGPPYYRFGSTSYNYNISDPNLSSFVIPIDNAFDSWSSVGSVYFIQDYINGLPVSIDSSSTPEAGFVPTGFYDLSASNNIINPSSSTIYLNPSLPIYGITI